MPKAFIKRLDKKHVLTKIDENNRNKEVRLLNQVSTYKYFCNFERDDIEVICNNGIIPIYFKKRENDFTYNAESKKL